MTAAAWRRAGATLWRRTTAGVVLLPPGAEQPVYLAGAAALVWDVLEEPTTAADVTDLLAQACAEDPARIRADIDAVLDELTALGVSERDGGQPC